MRTTPIVRLCVTLLVASTVASCGGGSSDGPHEVEYLVSSDRFWQDHATITYASSPGSTSQTTALLPWSYKAKFQPGDFLYVSAQNQRNSGSVSVSIYVDGNRVRGATSTAAYGIASASASCCSD